MSDHLDITPRIHRLPDSPSLGQLAGSHIAAELRTRLRHQDRVRAIFAAAPSQQDTLEVLRNSMGIDWNRVTAFQMDEYVGLPDGSAQKFANWLGRALFDHVPLRANLLETTNDPQLSAQRYSDLLAEAPIDIVCLGIGVNGHIAFNDPPDADLEDPEDVRVVEMEHRSRVQQVDDGAFETLEDVPRTAVTLTIPRLLDAARLFCMVPGRAKREAVTEALQGPIGPHCPATALRRHRDCTVYLDADSTPNNS